MEKQPKSHVSKKEKEKWDRAIAEQQKVASNPRPQKEAEEFQKEIGSLSPHDLLKEFNV